ncbi:MAG: hypothetical protein A2020_00615 [Lentisphaerae bacterium GWF2_45_14]|nr:MAG: hypothetical protein A2020_00615 [Lentisphaerae bacterium GWF2_45_14]
MKSLCVLRHAKSTPLDAVTEDFERPLSEKGKKDAEEIGSFLVTENVSVDIVISSPAKRAWKTAKKVSKKIGYSKDLIISDFRIYGADSAELLEIIKDIEDKYSSAMICGHNPSVTALTNLIIARSRIDDIPPCGICKINFNIDSWKDLSEKSGSLVFFKYP